MGKGIIPIYKCYQQNWPYPPQNTNFAILQRSDTSIRSQHNIASDASMVAHALEYSESNQRKNLHSNTDINCNNDSQSFETHRKNNFSFSCFGNTLTTTTTPNSSTIPPTEK